MDALLDRGLVPDRILRASIRRLLRQRLREEAGASESDRAARFEAWVDACSRGPIAIETKAANDQHYEVPATFFETVLGPRLKYSSAYYAPGVTDLGEAEDAMLAIATKRAQLRDGQSILELGCGWGSFTLWMAEQFKDARIVGVSNSASQRAFILGRARERGLRNVEIRTADMNTFDAGERFDRVVSVEMFEHMRNYRELMRRVSTWLSPEGRLFVHVFAHRRFAYPFDTAGASNWMGRHFFTGGQMPSLDLLPRFSEHLTAEESWWEDGTHYAKTSEAWLHRLDAARDEVIETFSTVYGRSRARAWVRRWRIFFMACAELFAFERGAQWGVVHHRFRASEAR
ncbi:MAG: class I SAM-dependent methyltransferase [Planctomycetes bacterium]|nr:class I SAM-dependent methyltransferase [Planctomycetota bacterium]